MIQKIREGRFLTAKGDPKTTAKCTCHGIPNPNDPESLGQDEKGWSGIPRKKYQKGVRFSHPGRVWG